MRLHQMQMSGNCYKIRLAAHQLGQPLELFDVDVMAGETRQPAFLTKNPNGRVPLLELDDGRLLPESNAILFFLADGTHLLPSDRFARAQVLQWMFFEQYSHEPYVAVARFWWSFKSGGREEKRAQFPEWHEKGYAALNVMDEHLRRQNFMTGTYSIADIALYAYTHVASEGGFEITRYSAICDWMERVKSEPHHTPIAAR